MRKRMILGLVLVLALVSSLVVACAEPAPAPVPAPAPAPAKPEVIELTFTSSASQSSTVSLMAVWWADELEKRTNNQVKVVQMTWGGALLKTSDIHEGIGRGVADIGFFAVLFTPHLFPVHTALQPVFMCDGIGLGAVLGDIYRSTPELQAEWEALNITPLMFTCGLPAPLGASFEVRTFEDLKAKQIRGVGPTFDLLANLGAVPISISSTETYVALQKGTIEGISGLSYAHYSTMKLAEVVDQILGFKNENFQFWRGYDMNLDTYNSLPDNVKQVISDLELEAVAWSDREDMADGMEGLQYAKDLGVEIYQLPPEELERFMAAANVESIWERNIKAAEDEGLTVRPLFEKMKKTIEDFYEENPHKTIIEQFLEK